MRIALLSNPQSSTNARLGLDALSHFAKSHAIIHEIISNHTECLYALEKISKDTPDLLIINGGDGTVDLVIKLIRNRCVFKTEPVLALLKGGTTNMIHQSLGLSGSPLSALKKIVSFLKESDNQLDPRLLKKQKPLSILLSQKNAEPLYGFFIGTGAIPRAILETRKYKTRYKFMRSLNEMRIILCVLARLFLSKNIKNDAVLSPSFLSLSSDKDHFSQTHVFMGISALRNLIFGLKTHATYDDAGLFYVAEDKKLRHTQARTLSLQIDTPWILDGEIHAPDTLQIHLDESLNFFTLKNSP